MTRRSRMRRESRRKRLVLSPRDIEILRLLARYRYLNSEYLHAFVGGKSEKRFKERLGDLFHEGYLDRPERQWDYADCRQSPVIYEVGARGKQMRGPQSDLLRPLTFLTRDHHRQFHHSVMICHVLAALELNARQKSSVELISWAEMVERAAGSTKGKIRFEIPISTSTSTCHPGEKFRTSLVPDAVFGMRYGQNGPVKYRFFALEVDRGTMPVTRSNLRATSYQRKLSAYQDVLDKRLFKSLWGLPNLLVLTVSTNATHLENLKDCSARLGSGPSAFLFKAIGEDGLISPSSAIPLMALPWKSSDNRKIDILQVDEKFSG